MYVKVREGSNIDQVNSYLNSHIRKATAVRTRSMITQVSDSLAGVTRTIRVLIAAVWVLAVIILLIVFAMMTAERRREFAVLRLIGMTRRSLSRMLLTESVLSGTAGALIGAGLAVALVLPFTALIETSLGLPYLLPGWPEILKYGMLAVAGTVLVSGCSSAYAAWKLSRTEPGTALREGT